MSPEQIVQEMEDEIRRRNEWYGLDNWQVSEVVQFVLDRLGADDETVYTD